MSKFILISVKNNINRFINKCKDKNIELFKINYIDKNNIVVKIKKDDFDKIKLYNFYSDIDIYKSIGIDNIKELIFSQKYFILVFILLLILSFYATNFILDINIIHSNIKIRELVKEELEYYGIKKFSYKKDFNELEKIKEEILENNKDKLEWLSITNIGMKYVIRVEERIKDNLEKELDYCNIISNKEALITKIIATKGEVLVNVNDFVHKDDILISGNILFNDGIMGTTCASGKVYGNVWYNTNVSLNRIYKDKEYTGKKRINFTFNHKVLRKNIYEHFDKKYIIKNRFFTIYKEIEYKEIEKKYTDEEAIKKINDTIDEKFKIKLKDKGNIISKKVLKKDINNSTIYMNVFVVTEEEIGKTSN